jgi:putative membrane protein
MRLVLALVGNIVALLATTVVPGIHFNGNLLTLAIAGVLFGLFNAIVRPIAIVLSIPFLIVSLGLFYFVLNGILLLIAAKLIPGYTVDGLIPAILGGLVLMVVNWVFGALKRDVEAEER